MYSSQTSRVLQQSSLLNTSLVFQLLNIQNLIFTRVAARPCYQFIHRKRTKRLLQAGAIGERPGGEGWVDTKPGPVCDTNTFSITGDRTVDKERVTDLREHKDFEKEFEVKTRLVGERPLERGTDVRFPTSTVCQFILCSVPLKDLHQLALSAWGWL